MAGDVAMDLHVHSALSACGGDEMRPPQVLLTATMRDISIVGIVDHNTARNAWAFVSAAEAFDVSVLAGLEVESAEGVHILALFSSHEAAMALDAIVAERLLALPNRPEYFGHQWLLNEMGDVIGEDDRLLAGATALTVEDIAGHTIALGGVSIPAHVDRTANGLMATLGFVPPNLRADLFEVSSNTTRSEAQRRWPELAGRPLVTGSDAHYLDDVGRGVTRVSEGLARIPDNLRGWAKELAASLLPAGRPNESAGWADA